jgi:hypothetical protein
VKGFQRPKLEPDGWRHATELGGIDSAPWNIAGHFSLVDNSNATAPPVRSALTIADPLVVALGRPNREQVVTRRESVATLLQALELTNGATLDGILKKGADKWLETELETGAVVDGIWARALGRLPNDGERDALAKLIGKAPTREGIADALWLVLMLPEFQLIY